jgi:hypothetical protein
MLSRNNSEDGRMTSRRCKASIRCDGKPTSGASAGCIPRVAPRGAMRPSPSRDNRRTAIAGVLAVWPHEIEDDTLAGRERLLRRLRSALRAERRRGICGHWTYDLARHAELLRIYRDELAAVRRRRIGCSAADQSP